MQNNILSICVAIKMVLEHCHRVITSLNEYKYKKFKHKK